MTDRMTMGADGPAAAGREVERWTRVWMSAAAVTLGHLEVTWDDQRPAASIGARDALTMVLVDAVHNTYRGATAVLGPDHPGVQYFEQALPDLNFGLFVVDQGQARRVGPAQDTMGLTVVGPDTLLASGHPDFAVDDEPLLGLICSDDGGRTWDTLSRRGTSDFHALEAAHGQVFAYDATAGQFLSSTDGRDWTVRSALELHDFAVHPADPDRVVATSDGTVLISTDGGRAWQPSSTPQLAVVAWPDPDALYGVGPEGTVYLSADAGARWMAVGNVGAEPQAITVGQTASCTSP